jgi:DNA replication licensing factor MCM4
MSSPTSRRQTPRRSARNSEAPNSSPAANGSQNPQNSQANGTPRSGRGSQLASSPLLYESSPARSRNGNDVSSPLRQMTNSQSTATGAVQPSSPLRQMSDSQSLGGDRTPRASQTGRKSLDWKAAAGFPGLLTMALSRIIPHPL